MMIAYPFRINSQGRTASSSRKEYIRDLMEQLLFTMPGERVNRPEFGCGLMQLIFSPNSDELVATTQFLVQGAIQQWLGHLVQVTDVNISTDESTLRITIQYTIIQNQQQQTENFELVK